uniref:Uncharacterized protein n=1 Tax=Arundo donax TaxID=35708 RepID=A0A0A9EXP1_ARUDO
MLSSPTGRGRRRSSPWPPRSAGSPSPCTLPLAGPPT